MHGSAEKYECIIWDWNGTLFDDVSASLRAVNEMMHTRGLPDMTLETYREYMDTPIIKFYLRAFMTDTVDMDAVSPEYGALYARFAAEIPWADTVSALLQKIKEAGIRQVILSGANTGIIRHYLEKFQITDFFDAVSGSDDLLVGEKTGRLSGLLQSLSLKGSDCLLIGDTLHDSETADTVGTDCVLISSGHQAYDALKQTGKPVFSDMAELERFLLIKL